MTVSVAILFSTAGALIVLFCIACLMWIFRCWNTRGYYLKDFHRTSTEARALSIETMRIKIIVAADETTQLDVRLSNMEVIKAADEWDTGLEIALAAWDEIIQPEEGTPDIENAKEGDKLISRRKKSHGRYVIGLMRAKCVEGIKRRRELSHELQRIHSDTLSRNMAARKAEHDRRHWGHVEDTSVQQEEKPNCQFETRCPPSYSFSQSVDVTVPSHRGDIREIVSPHPRAANCPPVWIEDDIGMRQAGPGYNV